MFANIAFSLFEVNSRGIYHRDLKPDNMLLFNSDGIEYITLTDFGSSKYSLSTEQNKTYTGDLSGTLVFNSPERINDEPTKDKEDVWAMGVTIYQLSSFVLPFDSKNRNKVAIMKKIGDLDITHQKIENRSKELNDLIDCLLQKDHNKRPTIKELFLNNPIVQTSVCDLLQKFLPIQNLIFEELVLRLLSDNELKAAYQRKIEPMI